MYRYQIKKAIRQIRSQIPSSWENLDSPIDFSISRKSLNIVVSPFSHHLRPSQPLNQLLSVIQYKYHAKAVVGNNYYLFRIIRRIVRLRIEKNCEKKYTIVGDNIHKGCNESRFRWEQLKNSSKFVLSSPM